MTLPLESLSKEMNMLGLIQEFLAGEETCLQICKGLAWEDLLDRDLTLSILLETKVLEMTLEAETFQVSITGGNHLEVEEVEEEMVEIFMDFIDAKWF